MLRASMRSAIEKYNIKKGLEILDNPNHHKMMRKELTMNIFPFGDDGTDPSIVIKLVCIMGFSYLSVTLKIKKKTNFIANNTFMSTRCWASPTSHSNLDFEKIWLRASTFCSSKIENRGKRYAILYRNFWRKVWFWKNLYLTKKI